MQVSSLREDLAKKVKTLDPIGKKLKFNLDGEYMLIDGSGSENVMTGEDLEAEIAPSQ